MHPDNQHNERYDLDALKLAHPPLSDFIIKSKVGLETIDFFEPDAVKALNKALLIQYYNIKNWDIPKGYLCPPIPGRAEYLHQISELIKKKNKIVKGSQISCLDIGSGANLIYPILGTSLFGWKFVGTEVDTVAIANAKKIIQENPILKNVTIRHQLKKDNIFQGLFQDDDIFDLTICNPPFHASKNEATEKANRKIKNLGKKSTLAPILNFGGTSNELWTEGGELQFISKMIEESKMVGNKCYWFSTLVSKQSNIPKLLAKLRDQKVVDYKILEFELGNKISRILAWTYLTKSIQTTWKDCRWQ